MISLAQNRTIFNGMTMLLDRAREIKWPLGRMRSIYLSEGTDDQQNIIKTNIADNKAMSTRADELINAWAQITQNEQLISEYMSGLENIMFMTQHKLRKPITNMIGIASLLDEKDNSAEEMLEIVKYMQRSAIDLDAYTRELTGMLIELSQKVKKK